MKAQLGLRLRLANGGFHFLFKNSDHLLMSAIKKEPFERIRSIVERRRVFEHILKESGSITCKGSDDSLFLLKPVEILHDGTLIGTAAAIDKLPSRDVEVIGNFSVQTERYFFRADLKVKSSLFRIPISCDVFKLQRRQSLRVALPPSFPIYLNVREISGKPCLIEGRIAVLSSGGMKIYFGDDKIN